MSVQAAQLHTDTDGVRTSSEYGDRGDGTSDWYQYIRVATGGFAVSALRDGADATQGTKGDAAVTDPTSSATVVALLKGILSATKAEDAAHASGDRGIMALGVRNDTRATLNADGDYTPFTTGSAGNVLVSVVPTSLSGWKASTYAAVAAASGVIKASAGTVYQMVLTNSNAAVRYLQFFNLTAVPADATVPLFTVAVPATSTVVLNFGEQGLYFSTGICWCTSTTFGTKTIAAAEASVAGNYL